MTIASPNVLKLLVDSALDDYRVPLAEIRARAPLEVEWLRSGEEVQPGRFHLVLLARSPANEKIAEVFGERVFLVGGAPGPRVLPARPEVHSLETILALSRELLEREQQVADSRALLSDLSLMSRLTGLEEKVECVGSTVMNVTRSSSARLLLVESDGSYAALGNDRRPTPVELQPESFVSEIARRRKSLIVPDDTAAADPFIAAIGTPGKPGHALAICLISEGRLVGLLIACRPAEEPSYNQDDLSQALVIGSAAAIAIDNLRLYREVRESYDRLVHTQKQLLQVEKLSSLGQLSAGIAHEINNPLFVIMGNLELAIERVEGRLKEYLKKALTNADRIKKIVFDLREFYAPSRNLFVELDINRIIENAVPIVSLQSQAGKVGFDLKLGEALPSIRGDDNQLLQVMTNLLLNAVQAMPEGGQVSVDSHYESGMVVISVSDTGVGIPPEHLSRVFDPFFTTKRDWTGTGLGLSVTHTIVENHHGHIEVQSIVGAGTTFRVRLPAVPTASASVTEEGPTTRTAPIIENKALRVLVVDDDEHIREYIQTVLSDSGVGSDAAASASEAMKMAGGKPYDLIFLDNKMPGKSGLECVGDLRVQNPSSKVVLLTGTVTVEEDEMRQLGFWGMLRKPCSCNDILDVVKRVADR
ncbi:MAG: response regulator [Candidatus Wallbacteria bacterium]|nr:response regulator [Candidatus Wallbacteria bacterium]